ncbi:MAG TPA: hypothetical protein VF121_03440 [Thermoanaerobaculia bacterium]|nr:hypothetical protein [Thermoanaerobaculia bacterium]
MSSTSANSTNPEAPDGWGLDDISAFLEAAHQNSFATFANLQRFFRPLVEVDQLFRLAIPNFGTPTDWLMAVFLLRTHAAFLGAVRLASSGQLPETYMLLRGCLEPALYALHIFKDPSRAAIWLARSDDEEQRAKARGEFSNRRVLATLAAADQGLHGAVVKLYERTMDHGAHPNERAFLTNMSIEKVQEGIRLQLNYLSGHSPAFELALKSALQTGIVALGVFEAIVPEKFSILGLSERLALLKRGL